jgi:Coenzyme PQQ synthesis protein D (PqqD)
LTGARDTGASDADATVLRLRGGGVEWREVDDEVIALVADTSTYVATNGSGAVLWRRLAVGTTEEELVTELVTTFGIDRGTAASDVAQFLGSLRANGLLAA